MSNPTQRPEGALIAAALKRSGLSARAAAERAGMSDARWRQIVNGYQSAGAGQSISVIGPAETIARMATVVGVTADELRAAGRTDAAEALASPFTAGEGASATALVRADLNRDLAGFTDHELLTEIEARMLLMASQLHAAGTDALTFVTEDDGQNVITSRPTLLR